MIGAFGVLEGSCLGRREKGVVVSVKGEEIVPECGEFSVDPWASFLSAVGSGGDFLQVLEDP